MHLVTTDKPAASPPITDALAWSRAFETVAVTNLGLAFFWWRMPLMWLTHTNANTRKLP